MIHVVPKDVNAVSGQESVPNALEGTNNVILTAGRQFLEATLEPTRFGAD